MDEAIRVFKAAVEQYEEGAITAKECINRVAYEAMQATAREDYIAAGQ